MSGSLWEAPMPIRGGAMQRPRGGRCGNRLRQRYDEVGLPCSSRRGSPSPTSTYAISRPWTRRRCFWYGNTAEIMLASPSFFVVAEEHRRPRACPQPSCGQRGLPEGYTGRHAASSCPRVGPQSAAVLGCLRTCDLDGRLPRRRGNRPRFVTPCLICVTAWGSVPSTPTPIALTRRALTRCGVHLKSHLVSRWHARYNPPDGVCSSHGMREPAVPWAEVP